jgi:hypothetical protein
MTVWTALGRLNDGAAVTRVRVSLALLTERRVALFLAVDGFFLFAGMLMSFGGNGSVRDYWLPMFLLPSIFLAVPIMADAVAVERRSGTLDLALTSPGARLYFERRVAAVAALMIVQGWLVIFIARALNAAYFPLSGPLVQIVIVAVFITAVTLNWSLRLKTAGAVIFATYITLLLFAPWVFSNPIHPPAEMPNGTMKLEDFVDYFQQNLVLVSAAIVFYLYALQRLSRPESIIQ